MTGHVEERMIDWHPVLLCADPGVNPPTATRTRKEME
jgi:hypothetical protein